ncbi:MAG: hypothetical protein B7Z08_07320 [Sphingomonadales bacterium 32-68-7]|nr:MAG: hypothetical protein B7Z33_03470 [Sphingomonadales bacterium 12-68-11]OYX08954.1 MAG: hypothetical protein B7Z08_07320 [Sphingomonadales bacterium 32-68-7]
MATTVVRKRLEILADAPLVGKIVAELRASGIQGWSVLHVTAGGGRQGEWQDDELTGATAKQIVLAITSAEKAAAAAAALGPLLDSYGMILAIGDVEVVRGERF